jgi:UDP-3-O-[3-hydroxymyristoyl] glucosamine N-acyltransferase
MRIDNKLIEELTTLRSDVNFNCDSFGLVNSVSPNTLSFIDDEKFLEQLLQNENITVVFSSDGLKEKIKGKTVLICSDPRFYFYDFVNKFGVKNYVTFPSKISPLAKIHPKAYVCENNVIIGDNTVISANVSVLADVEIGNDCFVQAGAVIGSEGYEYKRTSKGILSVYHDGKVIIGNRVDIGANATIVKGFSFRQTIIENDVKIDNLVYIAHGAQIHEGTFIVGSALVSGSVTVKKNVWIGPNATIANAIEIGENAYITLGSIVTRSIKNDQTIIGSHSIDNQKFSKITKPKTN